METNLVGLSGPIMISIDVTYRCNFRCKHCFNGSGAPLLGDELSDAELLTIAKSVGVLQPNVVCFCGGEPLLRWEILCDACETIKSKSPYTQVNLVTNGSLVTETIANRLNRAGITTVQVSVDGPNSELHDWFRNHPGSFDLAVNAIKILRKAGLNVVVAAAPHKKHLLQLEETIDLCRQLGVSEIRMQPIMPLGRALDNYDEVVPSYFEYRRLSRRLQELKYKAIVNGMVVDWGDPIDHLRKFSSSSFVSNPSLGITAYGEITVSPYLPISVGCIRRHSLEEYWESGLKNVWSIGVIQEIANLITSINSMDLSKENLPKINYEKNLMIDLIEDDRNYINHISLASLVKQRGGQHSIRNMDTLV